MNPSLVDTDILSAFFRGNKSVVQNVEAYLKIYNSINLSIITYYEILNGLLYKDAKKQLKSFVDFASLNNVLPLTLEAASQAAKIYANLRKKGNLIGHTDSLIAGIAIVNGLQLITNNADHFSIG